MPLSGLRLCSRYLVVSGQRDSLFSLHRKLLGASLTKTPVRTEHSGYLKRLATTYS